MADVPMLPGPEDGVDQRANAAAMADDRRWFARNRARDLRLRPLVPGEKIDAEGWWRPGRVLLVIRMGDVLGRVLISPPDPHETNNPWVCIQTHPDGPRYVRARTWAAGMRACMVAVARGQARREDVAAMYALPDQWRELIRARASFPLLGLRDFARDAAFTGLLDDYLPSGSQPDDAACVAIAETEGWGQNDGFALHFYRQWASLHRPVYAPSARLIDRLLDPGLVLDDSLPVVVPYSTMVADVAPRCDRFAGLIDKSDSRCLPDEAVAFVTMHRMFGDPAVTSEDAFEPIRSVFVGGRMPAAEQIASTVASMSANCSRPYFRFGTVCSLEAWSAATIRATIFPSSWSVWRAYAYYMESQGGPLNVARANAMRLLSGLCYVLAYRDKLGLRSPAEPEPRGAVEPLDSARIRRYVVDDDVPLVVSTEPIVRAVADPSGPLDTSQLFLTRTSRAEYAARVRCGPGGRERRVVVVPEGEAYRWMRLETLLGRDAASATEDR